MDVNLNSTLRSLEFAEENNCRYVFTSSPEAYGESEIMPLGGHEASVFLSLTNTNGMPMEQASILVNWLFNTLFAKVSMHASCAHSMATGLDCSATNTVKWLQ